VANTKSADKAARQAEQRRTVNVALRSRMRTAIRKVIDAAASGNKELAKSSYQAAVPLIDTLVTANHVLFDQGVVDAFGHISVRSDADPSRFLLALEASAAEHWRANFLELGRQLSIAVEQLVVEEGSLSGRLSEAIPRVTLVT